MIGSSTMVKAEIEKNGKTLKQLRAESCEWDGTSIEGINSLKQSDIESGLTSCIKAATKRAMELHK